MEKKSCTPTKFCRYGPFVPTKIEFKHSCFSKYSLFGGFRHPFLKLEKSVFRSSRNVFLIGLLILTNQKRVLFH